MSDTEKCAACGATLPDGAVECGVCKERETWVTVASGGVLERVGAGIFDFVFLGSVIAALLIVGVGLWSVFVAWIAFIELGYQLRGSLGKALFGLSVNVDGHLRFLVRETVGKLASLGIFGIGFLLIFSSEGLALHDLMAHSRVVRRKEAKRISQTIRIAVLLVAVAIVAYAGAKLGSPRKIQDSQVVAGNESLDLITRQMPAVLTIFCYDRKDKIIAQGSGFLVSADGLGVTNFHVLNSAYRAEAELGDGRRYHVLVVKSFDADKDVVVMRLGRTIGGTTEWPSSLPFLSVGSSLSVAVGDRIATIGSPEGLANSVTDGLISAIRRDEGVNLLQITAPISPGSSGGPVFDLHGRVIGITVAQFREGQNLNFAIPVETLQEVEKSEQNLDFDSFRLLASILSDHPLSSKQEGASGSPAAERSEVARAPRIAGTYVGTVHNQTADQSASFAITVRNDEGVLLGCMGVLQPLIGSGLLRGKVTGSTITFVVNGDNLNLFFEGHTSGSKINGTYTVSPINGIVQQGDFYLAKSESKQPSSQSFRCPTDTEMNQN